MRRSNCAKISSSLGFCCPMILLTSWSWVCSIVSNRAHVSSPVIDLILSVKGEANGILRLAARHQHSAKLMTTRSRAVATRSEASWGLFRVSRRRIGVCPGRFGPELPKRAVRVVCERQAREGGACGVQTRARGVQTRARGRRNRGEVVLDLIPGGRLRPRRHAFFCPGCCGTTVPASAFSLGRASGPTRSWAT